MSAEGVNMGLGIVQGLVVARLLGPTEYGLYALVLTFAAMVFLIVDPRSSEAVVRFLAEYHARGDLDRTRAVVRLGFTLDAAWAGIGLLLTAASGYLVGGAFSLDDRTSLITIAALGYAAAAPVSTSRAILTVFGQFRAVGRTQILVAMTRTIAVCGAAFADVGLAAILWATAGSMAVESILFATLARRHAHRLLGGRLRSSTLRPLRDRRREMVHFVVMADLTTLVSSAVKQVDLLLVGAFAGPREAGLYRLAKSLTAPAGNVGAPIQTILYPKLARAESQQDFAAADRTTRRTVLLVCLPLAAAALCSIPFVHLVIVLLAGTDYADATAPAIALVVGVSVSFATLHLRPVFLARDKLAALLALTVGPTVVMLAAMAPAADSHGATGVAWTRSAAVVLGSGLMLLYIHSRRGRHSGHPADAHAPEVIATESPL